MAAPSVEDLNSRLRARSSRGVEQQRSVPSVTGAHSRRRGDIQGLRAVAILLVVAFHAGLPVPGGFMGVDVFFAISGFVITAMLVAELEPSGRLDLPRFYVRRARRLLPALALMLTFVLLAGALISPLATQHMTALTGVAASVFCRERLSAQSRDWVLRRWHGPEPVAPYMDARRGGAVLHRLPGALAGQLATRCPPPRVRVRESRCRAHVGRGVRRLF
jgi:hypothetical protein